MNWAGIIIGVTTFFVIGIFHPIVIKAEYYFGTKCWWWFLAGGIACLAASLFIDNSILSIAVGVVGFSCFWSIHEVFAQQERVRKGWFPRNPKRKYPFN